MRSQPAETRAAFEPWLRALPWLAAAITAAPLVATGFPAGHDWSFELLRVSEYRAAVTAGQWPPYWGENLYGGYGSPVFLFYAPLFSALAAAASAVLGAVTRGSTLILIALSLASAPLAARFLDELLESLGARDPAAARLGAVLFVTHPYLLGDKLVRNADAEYLGLCLLPIALTGVALAARAPRRAFAWISAGIALVVLAHNLTALVAVVFALGLALLLHGRGTRVTWTAIAGGIAAGLALSAFFWLPALSLTSLIRPEELLSGKFDYRNQFQSLGAVFGYARFFAVGLVTPLVLLAAAGAALSFPKQRAILVALFVAGLGLIWLVTASSQPVWSLVPGLPLFQFPWRMLGPFAWVASAALAVVASLTLAGRPANARIAAELAVTLLLLLNAGPLLRQYRPIPAEAQARAAALEDPRSVRNSAETVTARDEYLPRASDSSVWRAERPTEGPVISATGATRWETLRDGGTRIELATHSSERARLRLARWAFPGWRIEVDGARVEPGVSRFGTLELEVPAGDARVSARLEPPLVRTAALGFSALSLAAWLAGLWLTGRRARTEIASRT